jgi:hypothetical protein
MYIITTSFWPNDKAKEVANVYVKTSTFAGANIL